MPWVTMHRKMSGRAWRMFLHGGVRVPGEVCEVEVRTSRRHGHQATEARIWIDMATRRGLIPERPESGATYRLPLSLMRGCLLCWPERHRDEDCARGKGQGQ